MKYEKEMRAGIMSLNNDIAGLSQTHEILEDEKNRLKAEAEDITSKKLKKESEIARVMMAINNLEQNCLNRKITGKSALKYNLNVYAGVEAPKNFDSFKERFMYSRH